MNYSKNKKIVISNHTDKFIEWIGIVYEYGYTKDNIIIYDRTDNEISKLNMYGTVIKSPNVGSNIYDIGRYIYENYDNIEEFTIFLKCNLLQRTYTNEERFRYALKSEWFVPINTYPNFGNYPLSSFVNENLCVEEFDGLSKSQFPAAKHPTIKSIRDLMNDLFCMEFFPNYIAFCPAANFVVPKNVIKRYSKNLYKKMMDYTDYENNPIESHMFERILQWMWTGTLVERCD
jgi:hypothetical protein